ncbi:SVEP1-like protein [Mya arenaria]|uniref:SVEP1-like protein n=1 Tax=Mya arenaria TaxID=6604 RepID=A0ABY7EF67_MYAAR|nr:SVEP1-like protein [Mya arenaria]
MAVCMCLDGYTGTYCQTGGYHVTRGIVCGRGTYCQTGEYLVTRGIVCGRGKWLRVYMYGRLYKDLLSNRTYCQTGEYHVTRSIVCGRGKWLRVYMSGWLYRTYCQTGEYLVTRGIVCGRGTYCQIGEFLVTRGIVCGRGKWLYVYMYGRLYRTYCQTCEYLVTQGIVCGPGLLGDTCSEDPGICANIVFGECSGTECVCQSGYYKTGPVTCSPVDCGTLAPPDNGAVDHTDGTTYTKIALFTCITGYARSDCGVPASTENGAVTYPDGTLVGATATYACTGGYTLSGSANSDCQTDGTWSDHVGVIYNGICHVTAQCATTHATCRNDGLSSLRCLCAASGEFYDPDIDACLLDCGALTSPTNGEVVNPSVTAVGQVATYACFVGYGLVGSKVRTCQSNGAWSGSAPICVFGCEEPVIPANGRVNTTEGLAVGHTIYYSCVDGYELVGQEERICEASSTWSGTAPTCLIKCPIIGNIENGKVDMSWGRHEGSLATFACNTNYALVGDPIITCEDTGVWGGIQPTCVFAMFPDIILAFGAILILLIIVDIFVVGICLYYRYYRAPISQNLHPPDVFSSHQEKTPTSSGVKREYPDVFEEDGNIRRQKFAKVMPDNGGFHPPPARPEEPNVVYRSTMKMNDTDDEQMNDNGYGTAGSHSLELSRSDDFDKHLEVTHSTPGPGGKSPRETRKTIVEEPEIVEQEEDEEDRFRFRMRAPPANITESLFNDKDMLPSDRRAKSAMPVYKKKYY